ncbi:MAG: hypothetical protein HY360_23445 [Verrucomicrobia bacterium]|nr:hypothetical protein [Verrucomicrobiota bacterium]
MKQRLSMLGRGSLLGLVCLSAMPARLMSQTIIRDPDFEKGDPSWKAREGFQAVVQIGTHAAAHGGKQSAYLSAGHWTRSYGVTCARQDWFPDPTRTAVLLESDGLGDNTTFRWAANGDYIPTYHPGNTGYGGNVVFLDGHGEYVSRSIPAYSDSIFGGVVPDGRTQSTP